MNVEALSPIRKTSILYNIDFLALQVYVYFTKFKELVGFRFLFKITLIAFSYLPQSVFTYSKLTIEALEQGVKYVQS